MRMLSSLYWNTDLRARMSLSSWGLATAHGRCGALKRCSSFILEQHTWRTWLTGCRLALQGVANTVRPMVLSAASSQVASASAIAHSSMR